MQHSQDLASIEEVRTKVDKAFEAWQTYKNFSQQQVDAVVEAMAAAGRREARRLAELAVSETGMGNVEDKLAKNMLNADLLPRYIRNMKTVGFLREVPEQKITEIGVPVGVVGAILPTTNPTSTAIYKSIIALKAGNAIVLSPHPRAKQCTCATATFMAEAAEAAGAPAGIIQCIQNPTLEATNALMKHPRTGVILSTGGAGIVRAAYSSGKPAFGVGPGNVPVLLDLSAPVAESVRKVVEGKKFDFGTVCSSEQTLVAERSLRDAILAALKAERAYLMNAQERMAVEKTLFTGTTTVRAECVGQSPQKIAQLAGFSVPADTTILVAEIQGVGKEHPLSAEKLSPVLALLFVESFSAGLDACESILRFGGLGHTAVIFATDESRVRQFGLRMPAFRVLVNTSSPQGSVGITTGVQPSMTLGCGAMAGNITSDNVGPQHLMNIKRIAWATRTAEEAMGGAGSPGQGEALSAAPKSALAEAVERLLAERGVPLHPAPAAPPATTIQQMVEEVVDRFLAARPRSTELAPAAAPTPPPAPAVVDFVCEADVRAAIAEKRKIYIGPRTIVTPAAKELAGPGEVLVMAQR